MVMSTARSGPRSTRLPLQCSFLKADINGDRLVGRLGLTRLQSLSPSCFRDDGQVPPPTFDSSQCSGTMTSDRFKPAITEILICG